MAPATAEVQRPSPSPRRELAAPRSKRRVEAVDGGREETDRRQDREATADVGWDLERPYTLPPAICTRYPLRVGGKDTRSRTLLTRVPRWRRGLRGSSPGLGVEPLLGRRLPRYLPDPRRRGMADRFRGVRGFGEVEAGPPRFMSRVVVGGVEGTVERDGTRAEPPMPTWTKSVAYEARTSSAGSSTLGELIGLREAHEPGGLRERCYASSSLERRSAAPRRRTSFQLTRFG